MGRIRKEKSWLKVGLTCPLLVIWLPFLHAEPPNIHIPRIQTPPNLSDFESMQPGARIREHVVKVTGFAYASQPMEQSPHRTQMYIWRTMSTISTPSLCAGTRNRTRFVLG